MVLWEALVLIVLIAVVGSIILGRQHYAAEDRKRMTGGDVEADRLRDEVRLLKERIQVLERVITDNHGSRQLDAEIERLRDR